jgi:hypothetical protein
MFFKFWHFLRKDFHKFRYYSAHDTSLNALLVAFDLINDKNHEWPPFGADLIIEIWKNNNQNDKKSDSNYYVQVLYLGEVKFGKVKFRPVRSNRFKIMNLKFHYVR